MNSSSEHLADRITELEQENAEQATELDRLSERVAELERRMNGDTDLDYVGDLRTFVESFEPKSHQERSLAIAYYLERFRGEENVTVRDIKEGYRDCRVPSLNNPSQMLAEMEQKGWLLRDGTAGRTQLWRLTATAQELVEQRVNDDT